MIHHVQFTGIALHERTQNFVEKALNWGIQHPKTIPTMDLDRGASLTLSSPPLEAALWLRSSSSSQRLA
jgi:hypothetical protein